MNLLVICNAFSLVCGNDSPFQCIEFGLYVCLFFTMPWVLFVSMSLLFNVLSLVCDFVSSLNALYLVCEYVSSLQCLGCGL